MNNSQLLFVRDNIAQAANACDAACVKCAGQRGVEKIDSANVADLATISRCGCVSGSVEMESDCIIETADVPIVYCDGYGPIIVRAGRMWWPLYREVPRLNRPGQFELVLQAWQLSRVECVPEMLERTTRALQAASHASVRLFRTMQ